MNPASAFQRVHGHLSFLAPVELAEPTDTLLMLFHGFLLSEAICVPLEPRR